MSYQWSAGKGRQGKQQVQDINLNKTLNEYAFCLFSLLVVVFFVFVLSCLFVVVVVVVFGGSAPVVVVSFLFVSVSSLSFCLFVLLFFSGLFIDFTFTESVTVSGTGL